MTDKNILDEAFPQYRQNKSGITTPKFPIQPYEFISKKFKGNVVKYVCRYHKNKQRI